MLVFVLTVLFGCMQEQSKNTKPKVNKPTVQQIKESTKVPVLPETESTSKGEDPLLNPSLAKAKAPDKYTVLMTTSKGDFLIDVTREWAPNGADRFYNLVTVGYYKDVSFFRVIGGFMAQFGMHGTPDINSAWKRSTIIDDPVRESNKRGYVTFAKSSMPNSRSTQLFINFGNNKNLDSMGFAPIGKVVEEPGRGGGMMIVDKLYAEYGEGAPRGKGPSQMLLGNRGNSYLKKEFPNLDYIISARVCGEGKVENAPDYCP
jgi:peptidyl-prolyl cis-trans isomerase A (cyclophilin A)